MSPASDQGAFQWKRRMGVHEAYHQSTANRWVHWICIPLELWGVTQLLSLLTLWGPIDAALLAIALLAPIYLATEPLLGAIMVAALAGLWWTTRWINLSTGVEIAIGTAAFIMPFIVQTQIGHRVFEPEGRDDTEKNIAEFRRTKNPIPLLLVFYYHLVEIALWLGYRPALREAIARFTAQERATF